MKFNAGFISKIVVPVTFLIILKSRSTASILSRYESSFTRNKWLEHVGWHSFERFSVSVVLKSIKLSFLKVYFSRNETWKYKDQLSNTKGSKFSFGQNSLWLNSLGTRTLLTQPYMSINRQSFVNYSKRVQLSLSSRWRGVKGQFWLDMNVEIIFPCSQVAIRKDAQDDIYTGRESWFGRISIHTI